jgi:beta-1,4-N-acetylglucosaminyltransferase
MFSLIRSLDPDRYKQRTYLISSGDSFSASKALEFERKLKNHGGKEESQEIEAKDALLQCDYRVVTVPRARRIHQSLWTTPWSSLLCLLACMRLLVGFHPKSSCGTRILKFASPDLILTNGPATGVIVVLASLIIRYLGLQRGGQMRTIFVESWARVRTLSLSGNILLRLGLTDRFFVQWEALKGGRKEWRGFLVD